MSIGNFVLAINSWFGMIVWFNFGVLANLTRLWMIHSLVVAPLISLSLNMPSPPVPQHVPQKPIKDPKISKVDTRPLKQLATPAYEPIAQLEPIYVNKLRPLGTYANTYAPGWCTYGVASRLPIPNDWGNANTWASSASNAGYSVSNIPQVGSIAHTYGDSYLGHVAIVEAINPDGSFLIWEMNGIYGFNTVDTRTTTTAEFQNFILV